MAFLDPADLAGRLLRRPLTPARLAKFARLCRTPAVWEAALAAMPDPAVRAQVRAGTAPLIANRPFAAGRWPS